MSKSATQPLPASQLEDQLNALSLILAMFPDPAELSISTTDMHALQSLQENPTSIQPPDISLAVQIALDPTHSIQVNITAPLRCACASATTDDEAPPLTYSVRQPVWLDKSSLAELCSDLPSDIFSALEQLREEGVKFLPSSDSAAAAGPVADTPAAELVRTWFYFPSLSTREKRIHMVQWAGGYSLTGFVLAGKPGMLCLEGTAKDIDAYMNEIKTVSWSDIPSHQKKVSERYREVIEKRGFEGMVEITEMLERRGQRANRGDMKALEGWLREKDLGDAFENVILQSSS